jgi:hypothetical protein
VVVGLDATFYPLMAAGMCCSSFTWAPRVNTGVILFQGTLLYPLINWTIIILLSCKNFSFYWNLHHVDVEVMNRNIFPTTFQSVWLGVGWGELPPCQHPSYSQAVMYFVTIVIILFLNIVLLRTIMMHQPTYLYRSWKINSYGN